MFKRGSEVLWPRALGRCYQRIGGGEREGGAFIPVVVARLIKWVKLMLANLH